MVKASYLPWAPTSEYSPRHKRLGHLKKQFCVYSFIPIPRKEVRKPHHSHQDFLWPQTSETATSRILQARTSLDTDFGCGIKCNPTGNRLKLVPAVQVTWQWCLWGSHTKQPPSPPALRRGFLIPSAKLHRWGSWFTCEVETVPSWSPLLHDKPSHSHSLHLCSPSQNIFYLHQLWDSSGLLAGVCRTNPSLH